MNKKGQDIAIIGVIVAIILGVVLLGVIYTMVVDRTTRFSTTQSGINYSLVGDVGLNYTLTKPVSFADLVGLQTFANSSDAITDCNVTEYVDKPYLKCSGNYSNVSASYGYIKEDYYTGATTRTIGGIIPIMLAVGILMLIAFVLIKR